MGSKINLLCVLSKSWQGALGFSTRTLIIAHFTPLSFCNAHHQPLFLLHEVISTCPENNSEVKKCPGDPS